MDRVVPSLPGGQQPPPRLDYEGSFQQQHQQPQQQPQQRPLLSAAQNGSPEQYTSSAPQQDNYRDASSRPRQGSAQLEEQQLWREQQQHRQEQPAQPQQQSSTPPTQNQLALQQARAQQQQQDQDLAKSPTRKSRSFSFGSSHSAGKNSISKKFGETSAEKEAKRLHSKADPRLAMQEAEPAEVAAMVKSSLKSLRAFSYKDCNGNIITDPDVSNPTRSRMERPLQTIQSFEAAIDGGYSRRSIYRSDSDSVAWGSQGNQRHSYYGNNSVARFRPDSYYSRSPSHYPPRRENGVQDPGMSHGYGQPDGYGEPYNGNGSHVGPGSPVGRRGFGRMMPEPHMGPPSRGLRSNETVVSAFGGSGMSAEPAGYQTDPTSSDNSSVERERERRRRQPPARAPNGYGIASKDSHQAPHIGFAPTEEARNPTGSTPHGVGNGIPNRIGTGGNGGVSGNAPAPIPRKQVVNAGAAYPRKAPSVVQIQPTEAAPKRKSWLMRRFSRH